MKSTLRDLIIDSSLIILGGLIYFLSYELIPSPTHDLAKSISMIIGLGCVIAGWIGIGDTLCDEKTWNWAYLYSIISSVIVTTFCWDWLKNLNGGVMLWYNYIFAVSQFIIFSFIFIGLFNDLIRNKTINGINPRESGKEKKRK